jgi:hypothetical protein
MFHEICQDCKRVICEPSEYRGFCQGCGRFGLLAAAENVVTLFDRTGHLKKSWGPDAECVNRLREAIARTIGNEKPAFAETIWKQLENMPTGAEKDKLVDILLELQNFLGEGKNHE